nr:uncharacterized protein LOC105875138 isoform X1 [Microcebus murinus]
MVKGFPCTGTAVLKVPETLWVFEVKTISSYFHNSLFSLSSCLKYTIEFSRGCMKHDDVITLMASGMFSRIFQDEVFGVLNNLTSAPGVLGKSQGPPLTECLPGMRPHFARWIHLRGIQKAANLTVLAGSLQRSNGAGEKFSRAEVSRACSCWGPWGLLQCRAPMACGSCDGSGRTTAINAAAGIYSVP